MPWLIAVRVVSLPATASRMKKDAISSSVSRSPSSSVLTSADVRSSLGCLTRCWAMSRRTAASDAPASRKTPIGFSVSGGRNSGSPPDRMTFDFSKISWCWLSGIPIRLQITISGIGAAISLTKSALPLSITRSRTSTVIFSTSSMNAWIIFGVKRRETMPRRRWWRGSSMLIIEP
jgi:hypothetical protein